MKLSKSKKESLELDIESVADFRGQGILHENASNRIEGLINAVRYFFNEEDYQEIRNYYTKKSIEAAEKYGNSLFALLINLDEEKIEKQESVYTACKDYMREKWGFCNQEMSKILDGYTCKEVHYAICNENYNRYH